VEFSSVGGRAVDREQPHVAQPFDIAMDFSRGSLHAIWEGGMSASPLVWGVSVESVTVQVASVDRKDHHCFIFHANLTLFCHDHLLTYYLPYAWLQVALPLLIL